jgi:hypothetical protein
MLYFEQFPTLYYTFDPDNQEFYTLTNIFTRVNVLSSVLQNSLVYYKYAMQDGDTIESIAFKYYGDPLRHWMVIFANMAIDPYFDFVLNNDAFSNNIIAAYGSEANAQSQIAVYQQTETVTTVINGVANTKTYSATVTPEPYTYNFATNQLVPRTLPTIDNPVVIVSNNSVITPDGALVTTVTTLTAVTAYDNQVAINEAKREIILIDTAYAPQIEAQFQSLLGS